MIDGDSRPEATNTATGAGGLSWRWLVSGKKENGRLSQALASKVIHLAVNRSSGEKWGRTQDRHRGPSLR